MEASLRSRLDSLCAKFCNDFQAYLDWWKQSDNVTDDDFNDDLGIRCERRISVYNDESGELDELSTLFFGFRGIVYYTETTKTSIIYSPSAIVKCIEKTLDKYPECHIMEVTYADGEGTEIFSGRVSFEQVTEFLNYRNNLIENIIDSAVNRTIKLNNFLSTNEILIDEIANFYDTFPKIVFTIPKAYFQFIKNSMDDFCRAYLKVKCGSWSVAYLDVDISAIDFNRVYRMMEYLGDYIVNEYNIPDWCSYTIAFYLIRQEAISRIVDEAQSKYGITYDGTDRKAFVINCLETGKLLADDGIGQIYIAWCLTNDSSFQAIIPDPFFQNLDFVESVVEEYKTTERKSAFSHMLKKPRKSEQDIPTQMQVTIDDVDLMTGVEFEAFVSVLFQKMGFQVSQTKISGDQGIDVIAEKGTMRIGIQAKCYGGSVGNSAVQEAVAGQAYYNLNKAMVVTNSQFTPSAIALAQANNVVLWDRNILADKLSLIKQW